MAELPKGLTMVCPCCNEIHDLVGKRFFALANRGPDARWTKDQKLLSRLLLILHEAGEGSYPKTTRTACYELEQMEVT